MSITNKILLTSKLACKDQLLLLSYYAENPKLLDDAVFNEYLTHLDWSTFSVYERHHLMCLITSISSKKPSAALIQPYHDIVVLAKKPSFHKWQNLSQNRFFKQQSLVFKTTMLAMLDTLPNFWIQISNTNEARKFEDLKRILSLSDNTNISVLNALLDGPLYYSALNSLDKFSYDMSGLETLDIQF